MYLGTLAVGLGSLPLANGPYHPLTDSRVLTLMVFGVYLDLVDW
jgi:hypothetical protein